MDNGFQQFRVEAPAGINFSREPSQLAAQLWDEGDNALFRYGVSKKTTGYERGFGVTYTNPEVVIPLRDDDQNFYWWCYAGKKKLPDGSSEDRIYRITSKDNHDDVTPTNGIDDSSNRFSGTKWTGDTINSVPYLSKGKPYRWDQSIGKFRVMNRFPDHVSFNTVRTYRNFMIGLNFTTEDYAGDYDSGFGPWEEGVHQNALWWSHDVTGGGIDPEMQPNGEWSDKSMWCDADPTRNSGWNFLGGNGGPIVDGKSLRDSFIIYRERAVWQMTYIGGINVFAFKELFNDAGALGVDCIAEIEGMHFVVGQSDIYMHNGVQKKSVADGVVRRKIYQNIDPNYYDKVFVSVSYKDKEAWVCIPEAHTNKNGLCNVAFVYNWEENHWTRRDIPDLQSTSYCILSIPEDDITWEAVPEGGPLTDNLGIGRPGSTWEEASDTWIDSYFKYSPSNWGLLLGSGREVKAGESLSQQSWYEPTSPKDPSADRITTESEYFIYSSIDSPMLDGSNFTTVLEKKWIDMGDRTDSSFVNKIYPLVRKGEVEVYMAGSDTVDEGFEWKFIGIFDPTRDTKLSCRISGNYVHVKFIIPPKSRAEIKGYMLDWGKIGRRS